MSILKMKLEFSLGDEPVLTVDGSTYLSRFETAALDAFFDDEQSVSELSECVFDVTSSLVRALTNDAVAFLTEDDGEV